MRALEIIMSHVIYNPAYTYKFQLKTAHVHPSNHVKGLILCIHNKARKEMWI